MCATAVDDLILVPTEIELRKLSKIAPHLVEHKNVELCGFGPIAAAARTANLLSTCEPTRCLLVGIAGTYDASSCPVGEAFAFSSVGCFGIGAYEDSQLLLPSSIGIPQWKDEQIEVNDKIDLDSSAFKLTRPHLLTVCAAAGNYADVEDRTTLFPKSNAEDMEGFGVALACKLAGIKVSIVRGISNLAGDRDKKNWDIDKALKSLVPFIKAWAR